MSWLPVENIHTTSVSNRHKSSLINFFLTFIVERPKISKDEPINEIKVPEGEKAVIECEVPTRFGTQIQWLKGGKPVTSTKHINIKKTGNKSYLTIYHVTPTDKDTYTSVVTDRKNVSKTTVFLHVKRKTRVGDFILCMF